MCGIIGYNGVCDPKDILLDGLKRLEYRGYDSAGIAILEKDQVGVYRSKGRIQSLEDKLIGRHFEGSLGIGHTRWATHGAPNEINAHPHRVGSVTLVHNGIIENYLEHKEALKQLKRKITSDTDSEIVAHLFDIEIQKGKNLQQAITAVIPRLKGSYAFVVMSDREPDLLIGLRNGAPLLVGLGQNENFLASDVQAILHRTNRVIYLKDNEYVICKKGSIEVYDSLGAPVTFEVKTIHWTPDQMEKGGYRHFMLKEIYEQSQAVANTIESKINHEKGLVSIPELKPYLEQLKNLKSISIVACGTARHAALVGKYYIEKFARVAVDVDFGSEFRYRDPILDKDSFTLLISQSGETADTLAAEREAKVKGVKTLAICNVRESTLARESDIVLYTNAGPEIGVASTKAFTTQLVVLFLFAVELGYIRGHLSEQQAKDHTAEALKLPFLIESTLAVDNQIEALAPHLQKKDFFFYLGRDVNYPIALEGSLKLKEISYAHAEGYPAGEIKHGPIALIDKKVASVMLSPLANGTEANPDSMSALL
ncbi:MAG: glutamine--fructose-6-phosphate transaminase (isomerizing), partial [Proteobacteria bacterium]|nr:glutamine--fructose-6-phosphate transaminase (isomerizing) [Pseudomonadota bacterium]